MSYGAGANYADVIEDNKVMKLCPKEWIALQHAMNEAGEYEGQDYEELASSEREEIILSPEVKKAYEALMKAFKKKTGLTMMMEYHDCDECGDRYDDINGAYWAVGGMYQLTKAGKKMEKLVKRSLFVTYG